MASAVRMCHTPLDRQASTRKTATTEFEGEAVLILTLFLRSSDRDSLVIMQRQEI